MSEPTNTDVQKFLSELYGGVVEEKLSYLLSSVALGAMINGHNNKKGELVLKLKFSRMNDDQVAISHSISHKTPTTRGHTAETDISDTVMYVGRGGNMQVTPHRENPAGQTTVEGFDLEAEPDGGRGKVRSIGK